MTNDWRTPIVQPYTGRRTPAFLHGVIAPMFTPCHPDHTLDEAGIRSWTDYLVGTGAVTTLFPRCGLGRMYAFAYDEVKRIIDVVIDQAADRVPVMPGTMGVWGRDPARRPDPAAFTRQSIELSQYAEKKGATAVVLVLPAALPPQEGVPLEETIFAYFRAVASEISLPIVMYQPPGLPEEYGMTPSLLRRLLSVRTIAGMKYSTGNMVAFTRLAMVAEDADFAFIAGDEAAFFFAITLGATAVIGQGCDINPETLRAVYDRMMAQDIVGAREAHYDSIRALEAAEGIDCVIAGLTYAARKGAKVQPYTKVAGSPYRAPADRTIPQDRMDTFEAVIDTLRARYPRPAKITA